MACLDMLVAGVLAAAVINNQLKCENNRLHRPEGCAYHSASQLEIVSALAGRLSLGFCGSVWSRGYRGGAYCVVCASCPPFCGRLKRAPALSVGYQRVNVRRTWTREF